jgi:muramidase (phage lysozyme)/uncharacterized protein YdbL (DUF1318 family)
MDENKNEDLSRLIPEMNQFSSNLRSSSNQENILLNAQRAAAIQARKQAEAQQKMADSISNTISGLVSFTSGLQSGGASGNFGTINRTIDVTVKVATTLANFIPVVGGAFKGLAEGAGEVAKFMVGQFSKAYGNFERLSDTGVVGTFEDMKQSAQSTGLNFDDTAKIFTKYSTAMSTIGGAAVLGRKRIDMIAIESKDVSRQYQRIGLSAEDFLESQVQYIAQLQRSGGLAGKTDKQLRDGSIRYIEMIDTLAKTTGVGRKELKDQIDERQRNARYLAGVASLGEDQQKEITKVLSQFNVADPEMAEGLQDLIAADGRIMTEKAKATYLSLSRGGMDVADEVNKLRSGAIDSTTFMNKSRVAADKAAKKLEPLAKRVGAETLATRNIVGLSNMSLQKGMDAAQIQKQIDDARDKTLNSTGTGSDLAETRRSLYSTGQQIEQLATSSKLVTSVMSTMAKGLDKVTATIYASIGEDLPPYLKLRKQENDSIDKTTELQSKKAEIEKKLADQKKKKLELVGDPSSAHNKQMRDRYQRAEKNIESELRLLDVQIKEQERETEEIKKKRVIAEDTPGGGAGRGGGGSVGSPPSPPSGGGSSGSPPSGRPSQMSGGSSTSGTGQRRPGEGESEPTVGTGTTPSGPGLGARQSERDEVNQSGAKNQGIGVIREMIASVESIGGSYNSLFGGGTKTPLTTMTINEVLKHQDGMLRRGSKSTAAGRYQFMSYTLPEYARKAKLDFGTTKFDERTQDQLADILIREKGYDRYKKGQITDRQFLTNLSKAWAGLPNPEKGGRSNYAGDGLNASHMKVNKALAQIGQARTGGIFSGPSTGYLAELHGDEAVIPANDGASKQQFQTLMSSGAVNEDVSKIFEMMSKKINTMITIAGDGVGIQKKAKKANVTMA